MDQPLVFSYIQDYKYRAVIGEGAFATVFRGKEQASSKVVAIKKSRVSSRIKRTSLEHEARVLQLLQGHPNIVNMFGYSRVKHFEHIALEILGPSLRNKASAISDKGTKNLGVPPSTMARILIQMFSALEHTQALGIVHRDIKPSNILCSVDDSVPRVKLIDFGLAKPVSHLKEPVNIDVSDPRHEFIGTISYLSLNTHNGIEQNPRDDLESLAYATFDLLQNGSPWDNLPWDDCVTRLAETTRIMKVAASSDSPLFADGYPPEFGELLSYSRSLSFNHMPNYTALTQTFHALLDRMRWSKDGPFDWTPCALTIINSSRADLLKEPDVSHLPEEDPTYLSSSRDDTTDNSCNGPWAGWDYMCWVETDKQGERWDDCTLSPSQHAKVDGTIPVIEVEVRKPGPNCLP